jgi:GNAT superfamily N-acetyltransferase
VSIELDRANPTDSEWLGQLIADAFHDLPPSEWLIPDPVARRELMPRYFEILVDHGMNNGAVYTTVDRAAAAIWIPTTPGFTRVLPDYDARLHNACLEHTPRFLAFDEALATRHPATAAHHHLAILAVAPYRQRLGIGTALLTAYHEFLDREGLPAYLEAASTQTRDYYLRRGYVPIGNALNLPGGPLMWPMWRVPQAGPSR